jgi:molecular chaperone GrpE (heat shock protein)
MQQSHENVPMPKWPFLLADLLLLALAGILLARSQQPLQLGHALLLFACVALGAILSVIPFLKEHKTGAELAEGHHLKTTLAQIQDLEKIAQQIHGATAAWGKIEESNRALIVHANQVQEKMQLEARAFSEFLQRTNDQEKSRLRLEVDKMRRMEGQWVEVLVELFDHVFALHRGAVRSRQQNVIEQIGRYQKACYDVGRRVGLIPFVAEVGDPFQPERHQLLEEKDAASAPPAARVVETLANGYSYQGQIIRKTLVSLENPSTEKVVPVSPESATPTAILPKVDTTSSQSPPQSTPPVEKAGSGNPPVTPKPPAVSPESQPPAAENGDRPEQNLLF